MNILDSVSGISISQNKHPFWDKYKTPGDLVREFFPNDNKDEIEYILWNETGWPCFFDKFPDDLISQLIEYRNKCETGVTDAENEDQETETKRNQMRRM
jgi:hypothetical protein